jgi:hypothetical protein
VFELGLADLASPALADVASSLNAAGALLTAGAAVAALGYAARQIRIAREAGREDAQHAREVLTYELYHHQSDPKIGEYIAIMADFISLEEMSPRKRRKVEERHWRRWQRMSRAQKHAVVVYMNYIETVAGLYRLGRLDEHATMLLFGQAASSYWKRGEWFIRRLRLQVPRAFIDWEMLADAYGQHREAEGASASGSLERPISTPQQGASHPTSRTAKSQPPSIEPTVQDGDCPDDPCVAVPGSVLAVAFTWLALLVASFVCYERIDAFADFVTFELGRLPFESIWFGAAGGWLISAQGIFDHNRSWRRSYDYWHYVRPVLGALIGTLGCLTFIVLNDAATEDQVAVNAVFYDVVALAIGYREASFRALITSLFDTIILPGDKSKSTTETVQPTKQGGQLPPAMAGS